LDCLCIKKFVPIREIRVKGFLPLASNPRLVVFIPSSPKLGGATRGQIITGTCHDAGVYP
jgi:hypothetical protein